VKPLVEALRATGHIALAPMEAALARAEAAAHLPPPVFLIGPPRSGTTLLYEAMVTRFRMAFIANVAHRFFRTPVAASRLMRGAISGWRGSFTSSMGHIGGWVAPNEGGWVWRRWLADGDWTDGADLPDRSIAGLRALTGGIAGVLDAPFLNKNVMHSNRLPAMRRIWPEARYIVVQRDVADNARSIIRAEREGRGPAPDANQWWSVRPRLAPQWQHRGVVERAVAQVIGVHADIGRDSAALGPDRFLTVRHEDLCARPEAVMAEVAAFLARTGGAPADRHPLPDRFGGGGSRRLDDADEALIAATIAELGHG
jgi:hypothetical protein